ncbi:MAG: DUF4031 domain-containing protein [Dehalococcoidia bacterium]|nr:DUF4031 domain-containing protein [Dehalococcoidia bacterium]
MTVYIDELEPCIPTAKWRWGMSCHLFADNLPELHQFAQRIGLKRAWFQDRLFFPHYDLTAGRRKVALNNGAVQRSLREYVKQTVLKGCIWSGS